MQDTTKTKYYTGTRTLICIAYLICLISDSCMYQKDQIPFQTNHSPYTDGLMSGVILILLNTIAILALLGHRSDYRRNQSQLGLHEPLNHNAQTRSPEALFTQQTAVCNMLYDVVLINLLMPCIAAFSASNLKEVRSALFLWAFGLTHNLYKLAQLIKAHWDQRQLRIAAAAEF